ncbi:DASH complex subunit ask1 [Microsporum audouinii]
MSHPPTLQRNLTLTEELEKLEQSITLTLQEIDSNFNRAHRIVTSSIIPIVEQYTENSKDVWEASKFWKQFFEASANVSLSGYEEQPPNEEGQETTINADTTATADSTYQEETGSYATPSSEHIVIDHKIKNEDDPDFSTLSLSPSHSPPRTRSIPPLALDDNDTTSRMEYSSAFDQHGEEDLPAVESPLQLCGPEPRTPGKGKQPEYNDIATPNTSSSTVFNPISKFKLSTALKGDRADPLMHRVLDKTYRVQATPLASSRKSTINKGTSKFGTTTPPTSRYKLDDSPLSSPELEAPKLHTELFDSPMIRQSTIKRNTSKTRTPAASILATPSNKNRGDPKQWDSDEEFNHSGYADDGDEDDTALVDFSPPKTMQFHVPQSRLLKTPAKEASKRIVSDLLYTAGGCELTDDLDNIYDNPDNSPSIVRRSGLDDETF